MKKATKRTERDSMGEMDVPQSAYWGAQTQRAVENFPVSELRFPRSYIRSLGLIKSVSAQANLHLKLLSKDLGPIIIRAAEEVIQGKLDDQFVVDIFQTGSGTSTNMNANEVIASRANELMGGQRGGRSPVHPNDHVNLGQSSNDVIPSCIHIAAYTELEQSLFPALNGLFQSLKQKAEEFKDIIKIGRTHLQDATPLTLGQEFSGYASMIEHGLQRLKNTQAHLAELALGGTAVGTGLNTHPKFAQTAINLLNKRTGLPFSEADNHFEAQGSRDAVVEVSAALKTVAISLLKIANDIRWLGSGPRCGIGELKLPAVQPGSSIMPGKVNPVIAEAVCQIAAQIMGNDTTISIGGLSGNFELNVMMPVIAYNLLQSINLLAQGASLFSEKVVQGLTANKERCASLVEKSLAMVTALSPVLGYDTAAAIAHEAYTSGKTIREIVLTKNLLSKQELEQLLDPGTMI